jgi:hypothetical protein
VGRGEDVLAWTLDLLDLLLNGKDIEAIRSDSNRPLYIRLKAILSFTLFLYVLVYCVEMNTCAYAC